MSGLRTHPSDNALRPTAAVSREGRFFPHGHVPDRSPVAPSQSLYALDWLNFFLAALLMGFGPFVGLYLADRGWVPANVGLILTVSGLAGLLTQIPAGELIDVVRAKRALVGAGVAAVTLGILLLGLRQDF